MTLPRTGSRAISVGGVRYRWLVASPARRYDSGLWDGVPRPGRLTVAIERAQGRGSRLVARVPVHRYLRHEQVAAPQWMRVVELLTPAQDGVVSPALVRRIVEAALAVGWLPDASGEHVLPDASVREAMRAVLDARTRGVLAALDGQVDVTLATELARVGEKKVMMEILCDLIADAQVVLPQPARDRIVSLAAELGVDERAATALGIRSSVPAIRQVRPPP